MSMDMGDMADMGGMDSTSSGLFQPVNMALARDYWYLIAGVLVLLLIIRTVNYSQSWSRLRTLRTSSVQYPTKPTNRYSQLWATLTAIGREMSYPQLYVPFRGVTWMTPPPLGRVLVLLVYWAVIIYMMCAGAIIKDVYFWERIGFRNAWVTVTQVPFLYLLASKTSIIGLLAGTSYERLNWLHRWVARTMFVTASVHGFHFYTEWVRADFVQYEISMMPMVKYGLGAWAILLWMVITSLKPFRSMAYEVFVVQHIIAAIMFLWVIYTHVPSYARYNIWFAIAAICFDRVFRFGLLLWQNINLNPNSSRCKGGQRFGHQTQVTSIGDSMTVLTIKDIHFKWRAGQHLYLWLPRVGVFEAHPYTIATSHRMPHTCICNSIQLVIRAHNGFSKRIQTVATKMPSSGKRQTLTALVAGPYGQPPRWDIFETLVLIAASTGASFTLPILESVLENKTRTCIKRVDFLMTAKQGEEIGFYLERLHEAVAKAVYRGIELSVHIAVTGSGQLEAISPLAMSRSPSTQNEQEEKETTVVEKSTDVETGPSASDSPLKRDSTASADSHVHQYFHQYVKRLDVSNFIRTAVEATGGETSVVVCGGTSLVAKVRTSVAKLSDERAVHKGTGAQGIHLHVEEYCF